ncbi:MAG TPA: alpha/beta fold hydrolase [Corynebacteriales bacterium]|nr:alpha/beta fold hydrolase [Mycobacteriales bacterium]
MKRPAILRSVGALLASLALLIALPSAVIPTATAAEGIDVDTIEMKDGIPTYMNRWDCRSKKHPVPVVMVHGTFSRQANQIDVTHMLNRKGFCVYGANIGYDPNNLVTKVQPDLYGTGDVEKTTQQLHEFVKLVKRRTGSKKVDIIGHSQGGLIIRNLITKYAPDSIRVAIMLGGTHNGSTMSGLTTLAKPFLPDGVREITAPITGPAVSQQMIGSHFITELNKYPNTSPGITYVVLVSPDDTQATPYKQGFMTPVKGSKVYNIDVKDYCKVPEDHKIGHSDLHIDPIALSLILWGVSYSPQKNAVPNCHMRL